MGLGFYAEALGIYRLRVPFEGIYTSVFLVEHTDGAWLVDCATTAADVEEHILPALTELGYAVTALKGIVLTHHHGDHAGGLARLLDAAPTLEVVRDVRPLLEGVCTYPMAGHTLDCIGVLDLRTGTLLSGDGLQGAGVDKYPCYTKSKEAYCETVARIQGDPRVENLLFSHAYEPWRRDRATGRAEVLQCLQDCLAQLEK